MNSVKSLFVEATKSYTIQQIAASLNIRCGTIDRWIRQDKFPPFYKNDFLRLLGKEHSFTIGEKASDQFYTMPDVADRCLNYLNRSLKKYKIDTRDYTFVEPSAGCGHFYNLLPQKNRIGIDIDPQKSPLGIKSGRIIKADFLKWTPAEQNTKFIVVGNPPFGRNGKTALDFMLKAFSFADHIGFILPPIFNSTGKGSCHNRLKKLGHILLDTLPIPNNLFVLPSGTKMCVQTIFQVWSKVMPPNYEPIVIPTCKGYVDIYNVYISPKPSRPSSNVHWAGKCDIYIPRSFWGTKPLKPTQNFNEIPYKDGYGFILKKKKTALLKFIKNFDWLKVAHISTNGSMSLRKDIINEQIIKAGFIDDTKPQTSIRDKRQKGKTLTPVPQGSTDPTHYKWTASIEHANLTEVSQLDDVQAIVEEAFTRFRNES